MSSLEAVDKKALEIKDGSEQVWIYVQDAVGLICKENPKLHNLGDLITSIKRYGFQEVAKYDATLGAVKAGNGRIEALALMERDGYDVPRGIGVEKDSGSWAMPMTVGTDAKSRSEALAYLTDSNNLVMAGGDLDGFDMARMWGPSYADFIMDLPLITVDDDLREALSSPVLLDDALDDVLDDALDGGSSSADRAITCPACGHEWRAA